MDYKVSAPEHMNETFVRAFNSKQIHNLMLLYEPDAVLVRQDGSLAHGTDQIREELLALLSQGVRAEGYNQFAITHGNVALLRANFTIILRGENGKEFSIEGSSSEVVRQQADGSWLYIIDHPFGASGSQV